MVLARAFPSVYIDMRARIDDTCGCWIHLNWEYIEWINPTYADYPRSWRRSSSYMPIDDVPSSHLEIETWCIPKLASMHPPHLSNLETSLSWREVRETATTKTAFLWEMDNCSVTMACIVPWVSIGNKLSMEFCKVSFESFRSANMISKTPLLNEPSNFAHDNQAWFHFQPFVKSIDPT